MPVVRKDSLDETIAILSKQGTYAFDTETTGLRYYLGDRMFSLIICGADGAYYFNFKSYGSTYDQWTLDLESTRPLLRKLFSNPENRWFAHNAKFDLAMLAKDGIDVSGEVHCTEAVARVLYNKHFTYGLDECAKRIGLEKSTIVDEYITKHKLYTKDPAEFGKDEKLKHFDRVPFELITEYGLKDGEITYALGLRQLADLAAIESQTPKNLPNPRWVYENELALTKVCFRMEQEGILVDKEYSKRAYDYETSRAREAADKFSRISGMEFIDSAFPLAKAFDAAGEAYPRTAPSKTRPNGTPSFTDAVLEGFTTPLAQLLRDYRNASKLANTYYANFIRYADSSGRIHANMRQGGTATGRFSYSEPNLQNLPKDEDVSQEFLVRRAFIPPPDYFLGMIDYDQMEYRLMLDCAGEMKVIDKILNEGLDVHTATAQTMDVKRERAKTLNFLLIYGGGAGALAAKLGCSVSDAKELKNKYFRDLQYVRRWTQKIEERAADQRQPLVNWMGRRYHFDLDHLYVAPNHYIQGGCADIVRVAMNRIANCLESRKLKTKMLVQIHDELLFQVHKDEAFILPILKEIMERAYPSRHLPLTCGISHSWKSWADKTKGVPT